MAVLIQRAQILVQQGRFEDAFTALRQHLSANAHDTDGLAGQLGDRAGIERTQALGARADVAHRHPAPAPLIATFPECGEVDRIAGRATLPSPSSM